MKTAATAWYNAVPSILMVAPNGRTKEETSSLIPNSFSQRSMVTGRVAPLELVEKASNWAGPMAEMNRFNGTEVNSLSSSG